MFHELKILILAVISYSIWMKFWNEDSQWGNSLDNRMVMSLIWRLRFHEIIFVLNSLLSPDYLWMLKIEVQLSTKFFSSTRDVWKRKFLKLRRRQKSDIFDHSNHCLIYTQLNFISHSIEQKNPPTRLHSQLFLSVLILLNQPFHL